MSPKCLFHLQLKLYTYTYVYLTHFAKGLENEELLS